MKRKASRGREWVTASEVAEVSICPYKLHLKRMGAVHSIETRKKFEYGDHKHNQYNKRHRKTKRATGVKRFIAVMVLVVIAFFVYALFKTLVHSLLGG